MLGWIVSPELDVYFEELLFDLLFDTEELVFNDGSSRPSSFAPACRLSAVAEDFSLEDFENEELLEFFELLWWDERPCRPSDEYCRSDGEPKEAKFMPDAWQRAR